MSVKVKQALNKCFGQIKDGTFDEETIRTILYVSRDYIKKDGLIKELAHFIAHPNRDRGLCHSKLNNRYAKWKLVDEQLLKLDGNTDIRNRIKNEADLNNFMLAGIAIDKIDAKLFEVLYFDGVNDISEDHLIKHTGLNRIEAEKFLKTYYQKENGFYILKTNELDRKITGQERVINHFGLDVLDENSKAEMLKIIEGHKKTRNWISGVRKKIDEVQKVIRGTIDFSSVFSSDVLYNEIQSTLTTLIELFDLDRSLVSYVEDNKDDIQLCIMTLLHDSSFKFYDDNTAKTFLCFYLDVPDGIERNNNDSPSVEMIEKYGVIGLYITYKIFDKSNSYSLFVSNLKIAVYLDLTKIDLQIFNSMIVESPFTTAKRVDRKLKLVVTE